MRLVRETLTGRLTLALAPQLALSLSHSVCCPPHSLSLSQSCPRHDCWLLRPRRSVRVHGVRRHDGRGSPGSRGHQHHLLGPHQQEDGQDSPQHSLRHEESGSYPNLGPGGSPGGNYTVLPVKEILCRALQLSPSDCSLEPRPTLLLVQGTSLWQRPRDNCSAEWGLIR